MNYRHAYHAGNFADVLKHTILALTLDYLKRKPQPFRVVDTHAGRGSYDLGGVEANKTSEWKDGIGRLLAAPMSDGVRTALQPYMEAVAIPADAPLTTYPGSPLLARRLMRRDDVLIANERHPQEAAELERVLDRQPNTRVMQLDGWHAIKSLLPPKERRGLVLIDPPFEDRNEFDRVAQAITDGLARFANGTYIAWYPIKSPSAPEPLMRVVKSSARPWLDCRLKISHPAAGLGLTETGVAVINPPYTLTRDMSLILPHLLACFANDSGAGFALEGSETSVP